MIWLPFNSPELSSRLGSVLGIEWPRGASVDAEGVAECIATAGYACDIRAGSLAKLLAPERVEGPAILIGSEGLIIVLRRRRRWQVMSADGSKTWMSRAAILRELAWQRGAAELADQEGRLIAQGIAPVQAAWAMAVLGMSRVQALWRWREAAGSTIRMTKLVKFALVHSADMPHAGDESESREVWREVRCHKSPTFHSGAAIVGALWGMCTRERWLLATALSAIVASVPVGFAVPAVLARSIDAACTGKALNVAMMLAIALVVGGSEVLSVLRSIAAAQLSVRVRIGTMNAFMQHVLTARVDLLRVFGDGDIATRMNDLHVVQATIVQRIVPAIMIAASVSGGLLYLALRQFQLVLALMITCAIFLAIALCSYRTMRGLAAERAKRGARLRDCVIEAVEARRVIRHYGSSSLSCARLDAELSASTQLQQSAIEVATRMGATGSGVATLLLAYAGLAICRGVAQGGLNVGYGVAAAAIVLAMIGAIQTIAGVVAACAAAAPALSRLKEVARIEGCGVLGPPAERDAGQSSILAMCNVSFAYTSGRNVLEGATLSVREAERVAIVGASGSGKSTVASILGGLLRPQSGSIRLGDGALSQFGEDARRCGIGVVGQDTVLFNRSIRGNVTYGEWRSAPADYARAIHVSCLDEVLRRVPGGDEYEVGDNGCRLSGGERARVAIARAIVRRPRAIVLDEVLARVGREMGSCIVERLRQEGIAVIVLTHDAGLAAQMDRVVSLEDGKLREAWAGESRV